MAGSWQGRKATRGRHWITCLVVIVAGVVTVGPGLAQTSSGAWSTAASMPTARWGLTAATGPDNRIYTIGGLGARGILNTVELYTPLTHAWRTGAPMPTARAYLSAATTPGKRICAVEGVGASCGGVYNAAEAYEPASNTWSTVPSMPTARDFLAAATNSDGRIYTIGGEIRLANTVEVFSSSLSPTATPTVSPTPAPSPTPTPRANVVPQVSHLVGEPGATTASFTVSFSSGLPGQGEVYFGSGPGCAGLVEVATHDLHAGTREHAVLVSGNDLPGTVGNNGIVPGATYRLEVVTITRSGTEVDDNGGTCYSVTIPKS